MCSRKTSNAAIDFPMVSVDERKMCGIRMGFDLRIRVITYPRSVTANEVVAGRWTFRIRGSAQRLYEFGLTAGGPFVEI
jgi:hypothetical protein